MKSKRRPQFLVKLLCMFFALGLYASAHAQMVITPGQTESTSSVPDLSDPETKEEVRGLVATMSDDAVRALLIERLDAVAEANKTASVEDGGITEILAERFAHFFGTSRTSLVSTHLIPITLSKAYAVLASAATQGFGAVFLILCGAIAVGILAERLVAIFLRTRKLALIEASSTTLWGILKILYTRLTYDIVGVLAFSVVCGLVINHYLERGNEVRLFINIIPATILGGWMAYVFCRFFFAPRRPDLRICQTTNERAWRMTVSFSLLAAYIVLIHNIFYMLLEIGKAHYGGGLKYMNELGFFMNVSMYIAAVGVIWYNRTGLTEILRENKKRVFLAIGDDAPEDLSWFALNWPKIAIALIIFKYVLVEIVVSGGEVGKYSTEAVYLTFIAIFMWPGVDANVSLFVARGIRSGENETVSAAKSRRSMQQGLLRVGRILIVGVVVFLLAEFWGLNLLDLAHSGLGAQAAGTLIEFLFILLLAYITWELVAALIGHWLALDGGAAEEDGDDGGEIGGVGLSRVATLLPIIRKTAQFLIIVVTVIMVLDNWGINTGPILAGAGVVGLAIGFGAQTLVKDIVSGLFFLADDAFRVGEYIDVGGTKGTVERISLRSLRLRHHMGLVHTIPYGEIPKLTNFSRDWVIVKLRFRVPFDTDIQKVKKIFKVIGADLLADPILGEDFLQPFKSQGVAEVDDNGIVVRGKFMAKPGKQFMIRKEVYVRVQKAFEQAGIPFARKQVMVHIPGLENRDEVTPNQAKAIGAAAVEASDDDGAVKT